MNLINKKRFDNQVFVQCDCGEEILEFCRDYDEEEGTQYFILYHGYFDPKKETCCSFYFSDKGAFAELLQEMRDFLNNVPKDECMVLFDKFLTYKNKLPGVLLATYDNNFLTILKYPEPKTAEKANYCSWEIVLRREQVEELLKELEEFR